MGRIPLIGISGWIHQTERRDLRGVPLPYIRAVEEAGGLPVLLPPGLEERAMGEWCRRLDGMLLTGGRDLAPALYGEEALQTTDPPEPERDQHDLALARWALEGGLPTLAICRGAQLLAVAAGGRLHQEVEEVYGTAIAHRQRERRTEPVHPATLKQSTLLERVLGSAVVAVNSVHHQAVSRLPEPFRPAAYAPDGVLEAFEAPGHPFCLAVQWHPEELAPRHREHAALFTALIAAATGDSRLDTR